MPNEAEPTGNAPAGVGMLTPQKPEGDFASAKLDAYHAAKLLERAIERVGEQSDEGRAMMKARVVLAEHFGLEEEEIADFSQAELKRMLATLVGPGEAPKPQTPPAGAQPGAMQ